MGMGEPGGRGYVATEAYCFDVGNADSSLLLRPIGVHGSAL